MKRTIQYITGLLFLLSCNSNKQENELTGNRYSCSYAKTGDYIEMFVKDSLLDSEILRETMRRSLEINCVDYRTDEEKRKDSLLREINFQF